MEEPILLSTSVAATQVDDITGRAWLAGATGVAEQRLDGSDDVQLLVSCSPTAQAAVALALGGNATEVASWTPVVKHVSAPFEGGTIEFAVPANVFGDGGHATTSTCLDMVARLVHPGDQVLDVGCGAGLLSVAAALRGGVVTAVDTWEPAVDATTANVLRSGLVDRVTVEHRSVEPSDQADVVFANIGAATLVELSRSLMAATTGPMVLSGLLEHQVDDVLVAFDVRQLEETQVLDGWATLVIA